MTLSKKLRGELAALGEKCGYYTRADDLTTPDEIERVLTNVNRRLNTERSYATLIGRKVGVATDIVDAPQETQANREYLGEKTLVKIEELQDKAEDAGKAEAELAKLRTEAQRVLRALPSRGRHFTHDEIAMMRGALLDVAGPTYGWRQRHTEDEGKSTLQVAREADAERSRAIDAQYRESSPESDSAAPEPGTQLHLPEEPPEGTIVELRGNPDLAERWRCQRVVDDLRWVKQNTSTGEARALSWPGLWRRALDGVIHGGQGDFTRYMKIVPNPFERGEIIEWEDRKRAESLPHHAVVRAKHGGIAHRVGDGSTIRWVIAGSDLKYTSLPDPWFPVAVVDVGEQP